MPKHDPLPPPPNVPDQLSDADEMERVLEEHLLLKINQPEPSVRGADQVERSGSSKPESVAAQLAVAKDNDEIRLVVENLAKKFMSPEQAESFSIPVGFEARGFFIKVFNTLNEAQTIDFLEEFYKGFPNGRLLTEFCFNLRNISLLRSWPMSQLRDKMDKISQAIVAIKAEIVRAGGSEDISPPKIIGGTSEISGWIKKEDEISGFLDALNSQQSIEVISKMASASNMIAGRAAAVGMADCKVKETFDPSDGLSAYLKNQDPMLLLQGTSYFTSEVSRSFDRILLNGRSEVDGSLGAIVKIAREGGLYLGYFQESPDKSANAVVLCPNVL